MERENVKQIVLYSKRITGMLKLLRQEQDDLEDEYSGLRGMNMDGMPHGTAPGNAVEALAMQAIENDVSTRLRNISARIRLLKEDAAAIRECLDALNGKYKRVISLRYLRCYSWAKISIEIGVPDSTVRNWHDKALDRLGEALDEVPEVDKLLARASRART